MTEYADQEKSGDSDRPTDGYTMVDADVSYRAALGDAELTVFLRGTNLLDEEARRSTSFLKDFAPQPGASVHAGVRVDF